MKTKLASLLLASSFILAQSSATWAETDESLENLSLEELLEVEIVTASRYAQRLEDSPMSVTVLTADQIRESGARDIPEALRLVQGLEVASTTTSSWNVGARGFNELITNAILVLVDGRSIYQDFWGVTFWSHLPVSLADIHSIEIVRGPVSSLYGANAFAGVINIRTSPADGRKETKVWVDSGVESNSVRGTVANSGRWGDFDYRATLDLGRDPATLADSGPGRDVAHFNAKAQRVFRSGNQLTVTGGISHGTSEAITSEYESGGQIDVEDAFVSGDLRGDSWTLGGSFARSYVQFHSADTRLSGLDPNWREDIVEVELQKAVEPARGHKVLLGANARYRGHESDTVRSVRQILGSVYLNDEWTLHPNLVASIGARADHHPVTGLQHSPRASVLWKVSDDQQLRALVGSAYRNPSYAETYWESTISYLVGLDTRVEGNEDLSAERIRSFELSLQSLWTSTLLSSVTVYHNQLRDLIHMEVQEVHASPPSPIPGIPSLVRSENANSVDVVGVEGSVDYWMNDRIQWNLTGSFTRSTDPQRGDLQLEQVPRVRGALGMRWKPTSEWIGNLWMRYVSESTWQYIRGFSVYRGTVGDVVILDARVARTLGASTEIALVARNLLDHPHQDYPAGEVFGAQVMVTLETRF